MKVALYFEDPRWQLVLTPENEAEKRILRLFVDSELKLMYWGEFYETEGDFFKKGDTDKESLMLVLKRPKGDKNE